MFERGQRRATPHDVGAGERDKAVRVTVGQRGYRLVVYA